MAVAKTTVVESLTLLKGELTRGTSYNMKPEQKYESVKKAGKNHPNLVFAGEETALCHETKTNNSDHFNAKTFLKKQLPQSVYDNLSSSEVAGLSRIMNESAGVEGPGTLLFNSKSDYRQVTEFSVLEHAGDEESEIRIHYIRITAEADCTRFLFFTDCKMELRGEHRVSKFTVKNSWLQGENKSLTGSAVQKSLEFLKHSGGPKSLRM